jgi:outer membrane protein assembly factor BamE (lipoprotein component of BamABCDE complex)
VTVGLADRVNNRRIRSVLLATAFAAAAALTACGPPPLQHGYVLAENALEQVPIGSSREQVLLVLGTPSTTSALSGETYYYISQTVEVRPVMGRSIRDQRVLAVYFDSDGNVREFANYGLQDGRVFDFISRKTRTGGAEVSLVAQLLGAVGGSSPFGR